MVGQYMRLFVHESVKMVFRGQISKEKILIIYKSYLWVIYLWVTFCVFAPDLATYNYIIMFSMATARACFILFLRKQEDNDARNI